MCKNNTGVHIIGNTKYCINSVAKVFKRFLCIIIVHFIAEQTKVSLESKHLPQIKVSAKQGLELRSFNSKSK